MNDVIGRFMGYIMALFVFIMCVVLIIVDYQESIEDQVAQQVVSFVNECRETGVVDADEYARLHGRITVYGHFVPSMKVERVKEYSTYQNAKVVTRTGYETVDDAQLSAAMADGKDFALKAGDRVSMKVTEGEGNFATRMRRFVTWADQSKNVIVNYGGAVGE